MPIYSFHCYKCGESEDVLRTVKQRNDATVCTCGNKMVRVPENFKAETFEPYFDEGLNSDVYSRKHRKAIMDAQGVIEAGDSVHGGRNFDSKLPHLVDKQAPKGKVWNPPPQQSNAEVSTVDSDGKVLNTYKVDDLPNAGQDSTGGD